MQNNSVGMSMGKLPCLPHLPLPPTTWSLLRTSVSLHVNGDGPGLDTVIIHHNALVFFARSVANSSGQSCRKIEKFMKADAAIFVSTIHPDHYKIDVVVCILDELGVSISCEHWDQLKEYLRRTTCRNVTLQHVNRTNERRQQTTDSEAEHCSLTASSRSRSRQTFSVGGVSTGQASSTSSTAETLALRALVDSLQSRNAILEVALDTRMAKLNQLNKEKRCLQQRLRRLSNAHDKLQAETADSKRDAATSNFSLARVQMKNPGKWSWLTPLGKINVAVSLLHTGIFCFYRCLTSFAMIDELIELVSFL